MSDIPEPPRVHVTFPGGVQRGGRLLRWRQADGGQWWAQVVVQVPADAVTQEDGEDYGDVPREGAPVRLEFVPLRHDKPNQRALDLHVAGCWSGGDRRRTPCSIDDAVFFLKFGWAVACNICDPKQHLPTP